MRCNFVSTLSLLLGIIRVSLQRRYCRDGLSSSRITRFLRYYATIRLLESRQLFSFYYHLFNLLSSLKDNSRSPELPIIPNGQHAMLYNPEAAL